MTVYELIKVLEEIDNKNLEVYIHDHKGNLTTFMKVREYVDGVIIREIVK
jgi:hypothetical protein